MKIGIIVRKLTVNGGVQRQALSVASELARSGHDVRLYTFNYSKECFPELVGSIPVVELPAAQHLPTTGLFGVFNEYKMARRLAVMMDRDLDVLHPHDSGTHVVSYFYKKDIKNIPSVWYMNELPTMRWPLEYLDYVEDPRYHSIPWRPLFVKKAIILAKTAIERFFIRAQDAVLVLCRYHQSLLKRYAGKESTIVYSGVDAEKFPFVPHTPPKKGEKLRLLSCGIFLGYRRYEDIFEAIPELIKQGFDPELRILGGYDSDMTYYRALTALAQRLGIAERIMFHGRYTDQELLDAFAQSHMLVFPHLQSQGLTVYEAISAGLPSVVTPLLDTYETLTDQVHAMKALPKDSRALAAAIASLASDPALYEKLSREGSQYVGAHFSWKQYSDGVARALVKAKESFRS